MKNAVKATGIHLLTGEGGSFAVNVELRNILCLTEAGDLYVSSSHLGNQHVLGFMERLNRSGVKHKVHKVSVSEIRELYETLPTAVAAQSGVRSVIQLGDVKTHRQLEILQIIKNAVSIGASDVHIIVMGNECLIRFRVDGELETIAELTAQHGNEIASTIYMSMCDVAEKNYNPSTSQDARFNPIYAKQCGLYAARIGTRPRDVGTLMVIRIQADHGDKERNLESQGYLPEQIELLDRMLDRGKGIKIFSGPTGSGKTTTLHLMLTTLQIRTEFKHHLLTIENPPELPIKGANQTPLGGNLDDDESISQEWARAISNGMRLDPDTMMIGEIRDLGSAVASFRAAMTGHGLWTTLHANDVFSVMGRLLDMGVEISLLTDPTLITGLANQHLARKLCPECKKPFSEHKHSLPAGLLNRIEKYCQVENVFLKGSGCAACNGKGTLGRTAIAEVAIPTRALMMKFKDKGKIPAREYWVKHMGGITKNAHLIRRINEGLIDPALGEADVCSLDDDTLTLELNDAT